MENINFSSVAAMLSGKDLSDEQRNDIEKMKQEYEEAHARKEENK